MTTLDELRRANLKEQKSPAPERVRRPEPPVEEPTPPVIAPVASVSTEALAVPSPLVVVQEEEPETPEAVAPVSVPSPSIIPAHGGVFTERVRQTIVRKRVHPTGVKATVDMPPELFWRIKRYCRDHNNATVRQVFLDLMIAFLDEEGY